MNKTVLKLLLTVLSLWILITGHAQPCLQNWEFRRPIYINNSAGTALSAFQVKMLLNTQDLVVGGKMKADGRDIRIQDKNGNDLSFWVENGTMNKPNTTIWIKLASVLASTVDTIYLFYGNSSVSSVSSGQNTFDLFDDFNTGFLDVSKWSKCGGGTTSISGGEITIQSSGSTSNVVISSQSTFGYPIVVESQTNSVSTGLGVLGLVNSSEDGWAMAYDKFGLSTATIRLMQVRDTSSPLLCNIFSDQTGNPNSENANATQGIWSFAWFSSDSVQFRWPGGNASRVDTAKRTAFSDPKKVVFGNVNSPGSISIDWMRVRKFTLADPILSIGDESQTITSVTVGNNGPLCSGDSLKFNAPQLAGASYSWFGPNGFSSTEQNPVIPDATILNAGQYALVVSSPQGCPSVTGFTTATISDSSSLGSVSGSNTVCADTNVGIISISNQRGQISAWQSAPTNNGPWTQLAIADTFFQYQNLPVTTFYRIKIKNGNCPEKTSNPVKIQVDLVSNGGNLLGNAEVCRPTNSGTIQLINHRGSILNWLVSADTGKTWSNLTHTNSVYQYNNLPADRWYSAVVANGVCKAGTSNNVFIDTYGQPQVDFKTDSVCLGSSTHFSDSTVLSEGTKQIWSWEFTTGVGSTLQHPVHSFASAGTFPVKLKVTSNKGCQDSTTKNVIVWSQPVAAFTHVDVCDTLSVAFTNNSNVAVGSILQNIWSFGDGDTANSRDTNHYFPTDGTYLTKLRVISDRGCTDSVSHTVNIWPRVKVDLEVDSVCLGKAISFINKSSSAASSVSYNWDFGDGKNSAASFPTHIYSNSGTYEVVLSTTTNKGCTDFAVDTAVIFALPEPDFSFSNACLIDTVAFANMSSAKGPFASSWNFGNGQTSLDSNPKIKFDRANRYSINLKITSENGCVNDTSKWLEAYEMPVALFEANNGCMGDTTLFKNRSTSTSALSYSWSFGDGDTSSIQAPLHLYKTHGAFQVGLKVSTQNNCKDSTSLSVEVFPNPTVNFASDTVCLGLNTSFTNMSTIATGSIDSYLWDFKDGGTSSEFNPKYLFVNSGNHTVRLLATSNKNCTNDTVMAIRIHELPIASFSAKDVCDKTAVEFDNKTIQDAEPFSFAWEFGDGNTADSESPKHRYSIPGFYKVKLNVRTSGGCLDSLIKYVEVYALPTVNAGTDLTVSKGLEVKLLASADSGSYSWSPSVGIDDPNKLQPNLTAKEAATYTLNVIDKHGCLSNATMNLDVENDFQLTIYNVITPDGNGENDVWYIDNAETYPDLKIWVFDQNGREVYTTVGYDNTWAGTSESDPLPDGTYYYLVSLESLSKSYKGTLSIFRNL